MILTADLHLTNNPNDSYRFGIFDELIKISKKYKDKNVFILGDLTDYKNNHPSSLVNLIIENLTKLKNSGINVFILKGNHDFEDENLPYFKFLSNMSGVKFFSNAEEITVNGNNILMLPYTKDLNTWKPFFGRSYDYILTHATVNDCMASDSFIMKKDLSVNFFNENFKVNRIYSGDIHVPQVLENFEYVGAPYRIRFGDTYDPHLVIVDNDCSVYVKFDTVNKVLLKIKSVEDLFNYKLNKNDQVKIKYKIKKSTLPDWVNIKKRIIDFCDDNDLILGGIQLEIPKRKIRNSKKLNDEKIHLMSASSILDAFSKKANIDDFTKNVGVNLMESQ